MDDKTLNKRLRSKVAMHMLFGLGGAVVIIGALFKILHLEIGPITASVCNIANIAYALQRPLEWNPQSEQFIDDPGANLMLDSAYRGPWDYRDF